MKDSVQIFKNSQFGEIRTSLSECGDPLFCLVDVCKILSLGNPSQVKTTLRKDGVITNEVSTPIISQGVNTGKTKTMSLNFITEPNLYKCIFQSRKKEAEQFQEWVFNDVLPAIRKSGGYLVAKEDETPEQIMARALLVAKETIDRQSKALQDSQHRVAELTECNEQQVKVIENQNSMITSREKQIKQMTPSVAFAKAVETSDCSVLVGDLARILKQNGIEMGQNRLFTWMRNHGFLIKRVGESYNLPTQMALNLGLFEIKKTTITKPDGTTLVTSTPKVTGKGQIYFVNKFIYKAERKENTL